VSQMSRGQSGGAPLLIADCEPAVRQLLRDFLGRHNDCVAVESAEQMLELLRTGSFALVVVGDLAGGISGPEVAERVRQLAPDAAIIIFDEAQGRDKAMILQRVAADAYLRRSPDPDRVEAAVRGALERHEAPPADCPNAPCLGQLAASRSAADGCPVGNLEEVYRTTLKALTAALEARDRDTHGHCERVVSFSLRLGREMNLDGGQLRALEFGSLLHDIGKLGIPDSILRKPARLTDEEWGKMRLHPLLGQRILRGISFLEGAARVVAQHHERWDGTGYPLRLRGEEIDLNARIFAVADAFDAITSDRVYRRGRSYAEAAVEIEANAGTQFDPEVVEVFRQVEPGEWAAIRLQATSQTATHPGPLIEMNYGDSTPADLRTRPAVSEA
jgi:HD-GYP domain-containing protein (c-di-GMP phosphodiesterase class II)